MNLLEKNISSYCRVVVDLRKMLDLKANQIDGLEEEITSLKGDNLQKYPNLRLFEKKNILTNFEKLSGKLDAYYDTEQFCLLKYFTANCTRFCNI